MFNRLYFTCRFVEISDRLNEKMSLHSDVYNRQDQVLHVESNLILVKHRLNPILICSVIYTLDYCRTNHYVEAYSYISNIKLNEMRKKNEILFIYFLSLFSFSLTVKIRKTKKPLVKEYIETIE